MSMRVMEIYLQEVEAITYLPSLSSDQRTFLQNMAASFPALLRQAASFTRAGIPGQAWYYLLADPRADSWSRESAWKVWSALGLSALLELL